MKKRAYLEWLIRQHGTLKEQVERSKSSRDSEILLRHLKREKLRIKDQINALLVEIRKDESSITVAT